MTHQTYLKDCNCINGGIILYEGKAVCRWCRIPYTEGGQMNYDSEHFHSKQAASVQRDWEIVKIDNSTFKLPSKGVKNEDMVAAGSTIISVKRVSDGEVFTVGDMIEMSFENIKIAAIERFQIDGLNDKEIAAYRGAYGRGYKAWKKVVPLFTTSDGKPIFEGDKYFIVDIHFTSLPFIAHESQNSLDGVLARFSTKEAAELYIREEKPCLSLNEVRCAYHIDYKTFESLIALHLDKKLKQ